MRVHIAPCDRYRLRVTTWGSGAGPHAVVLPGISADWRGLAPQIRTLRRLGWTVHVVDLPGFALPPALRAPDATVVQLADYVARVLTSLGIPPALVLGHSLGGGVAMHIAIRRPELVSGLVLIAPVVKADARQREHKRRSDKDEELHEIDHRGRPEREIDQRRRNDERLIKRLVRHGAKVPPRVLSARAIIWANQPRRWRKARALLPGGEQLGIRIDGPLTKLSKIPTLVLWGDEDRVISASDARRCKELPLAQVRIARGVGHSLPLEVAAWANRHIEKFVTALTTTELRAA